ncbi:MAG: Rieske (2Fe-2S) protein, partial [Actinobacteria bacterium]|nr:Rieske (2Fe-2S) protein [Actinomycetota bacterium]
MKNRRNVLKIMVLGAISFVVAACTRSTNVVTSETSPTESSSVVDDNQATENTDSQTSNSETVITTINDLAVGQSLEFTSSAGISAILFRSSEDKVYALSRICTHEGCSVDFDMNQNTLICPCHG